MGETRGEKTLHLVALPTKNASHRMGILFSTFLLFLHFGQTDNLFSFCAHLGKGVEERKRT